MGGEMKWGPQLEILLLTVGILIVNQHCHTDVLDAVALCQCAHIRSA